MEGKLAGFSFDTKGPQGVAYIRQSNVGPQEILCQNICTYTEV